MFGNLWSGRVKVEAWHQPGPLQAGVDGVDSPLLEGRLEGGFRTLGTAGFPPVPTALTTALAPILTPLEVSIQNPGSLSHPSTCSSP